jgi:hypothetical protein
VVAGAGVEGAHAAIAAAAMVTTNGFWRMVEIKLGRARAASWAVAPVGEAGVFPGAVFPEPG